LCIGYRILQHHSIPEELQQQDADKHKRRIKPKLAAAIAFAHRSGWVKGIAEDLLEAVFQGLLRHLHPLAAGTLRRICYPTAYL
jgi:hypothetical protein